MNILKKDLSQPIGVFDSGLGGLSVLATLKNILPNENYIYYGDSLRAPYGVKSAEEIIAYSDEIVRWFLDRNVKALVIACNTATSVAAKHLRSNYEIPIIGMEPALKPAIFHKKTKNIAVMATQITLRENKFNNLLNDLIKEYDSSNEINVVKIPCPELVELVENYIIKGVEVEAAIKSCFEKVNRDNFLKLEDIDSVVLGCTHFSFLYSSVKKVFGDDVIIFDGNVGTANHLKTVLEDRGLLNNVSELNDIYIYNSLSEDMAKKSYKLFKGLCNLI